jgi:hypothetical protein
MAGHLPGSTNIPHPFVLLLAALSGQIAIVLNKVKADVLKLTWTKYVQKIRLGFVGRYIRGTARLTF